jgi:hypothetical protein
MQPVVCGFGAMIHFTQLSMLHTIVTAHMPDFPYYHHVFQVILPLSEPRQESLEMARVFTPQYRNIVQGCLYSTF